MKLWQIVSVCLLTGCGNSALPDADSRVASLVAADEDLARYVDPMIGTFPPGFVNPGPFAPFGMVQPGPDSEGPLNYGGYSFQSATIHGFSQIHMSAGVFKAGQISLMPLTGEVNTTDLNQFGFPNPVPLYGSPFDRATEVAEADYYKVTLPRYDVTAELTASERAAFHRYTYTTGAPRLLVHISKEHNGYRPAQATLSPDDVLSGFIDTGDDYRIYFAARFDAPFTAATLDGTELVPGVATEGENLGVVLDFATLDGPLLAKVGISYVDEAGALNNLDNEIPDWDFEALRAATRAKWNRDLALIEVEGGTEAERTSFYTALQRVQQFPNLLSDVDGRYRGPDGAVHSDAHPHYTQYSLWDSYRGQNQMLAELRPDVYADMVRSLMDFHRQGGLLPRWQQGPKDASHMSGDPVIPFIGEAWCRGQIPAAERPELLLAMQSLEASRRERIALGYIPVPKPATPFEQVEGGPGSTGTTLEYGIADFALSLMVRSAGESAEAERLQQQSLNYRNLQDAETGFIRPRHDDGSWLTPFSPELGYGFQEGTSWQYTWLAMHDLVGVYAGMGGNATAAQNLDQFFALPLNLVPYAWPFVQNQITLFGLAYYGNQFAPGNEHDLHAPFLYNYAGAPWKTQIVSRAAASLYAATPNGLPGNDDLGALSGWLVWTMAGLYPMNPGTPLFVAGSPVFEKVTLHRPSGNLVIEAPGANPATRFIQSATLNGIALEKSWLTLPRAATTVRFEMGLLPNADWGAAPELAPPSISTHSPDIFACQAEIP